MPPNNSFPVPARLDVIPISRDHAERVWVRCPACGHPVGILQPDEEAPDRLLGVCGPCGSWCLIHAPEGDSDGLMVVLPNHDWFRANIPPVAWGDAGFPSIPHSPAGAMREAGASLAEQAAKAGLTLAREAARAGDALAAEALRAGEALALEAARVGGPRVDKASLADEVARAASALRSEAALAAKALADEATRASTSLANEAARAARALADEVDLAESVWAAWIASPDPALSGEPARVAERILQAEAARLMAARDAGLPGLPISAPVE